MILSTNKKWHFFLSRMILKENLSLLIINYQMKSMMGLLNMNLLLDRQTDVIHDRYHYTFYV